jgi:hypothetical protein
MQMKGDQSNIPPMASGLYASIWEKYKEAQHSNPTLTLKSFLERFHVRYKGFRRWMASRGLTVRAVKHQEAGPSLASGTTKEQQMFLQFVPPSPHYPVPGKVLSSVTVVFPDGVSITILECSCEEVVAMVDTYERRRSAKEA